MSKFFCKKFFFILLVISGFGDSALGWNILEDYETIFQRLREMERVSVAFASQNLDVPALAFGHTLFVFHNDMIPESDGVTFEYVGDPQASLFIMRSLFWNIPGVFHLRSWDQRIQDYDKDGLEVWLIPLRLEEHEREKLYNK